MHEAFIKMQSDPTERDSQHFFATAATAMRQVLVDRARAMNALKRGGGMQRVSLSGLSEGNDDALVDVIALDDALTELATHDSRQAMIVELRFFAGLPMPQIAKELGVSQSTIEKEWKTAREWLGSKLG